VIGTNGPLFLQALGLLDPTSLRTAGHNSADYLHQVIEALKLAFADREQYYGDPCCVDVPIEALLSDTYAACRRPLIDPAHASLELRPGDPRQLRPLLEGPMPRHGLPDHGTVHVNVVDRQRNMVSATASGAWLSASPVVPALGFPLSSRCQTFSLDPTHPNVVAPGKQPRTTLTPTLVTEGGRPRMVLGTMGGDNQDQWNLQTFLSLAVFGLPVQDALEVPRISTQHPPNAFYPHEARPGQVRVEARLPYAVRRELLARGHRLELRPEWVEGYVLAIVVGRGAGLSHGRRRPAWRACDNHPGIRHRVVALLPRRSQPTASECASFSEGRPDAVARARRAVRESHDAPGRQREDRGVGHVDPGGRHEGVGLALTEEGHDVHTDARRAGRCRQDQVAGP
jgi:gamma-glutamyltranspeptidase